MLSHVPISRTRCSPAQQRRWRPKPPPLPGRRPRTMPPPLRHVRARAQSAANSLCMRAAFCCLPNWLVGSHKTLTALPCSAQPAAQQEPRAVAGDAGLPVSISAYYPVRHGEYGGGMHVCI